METQVLQEVANNSSMWDLLWSADMVTKVVLIGLILASVWSWAIIFEKFGTLRQMKNTGYIRRWGRIRKNRWQICLSLR